MEEKAATTAKSRITRRRRRSTFTGWQLQLTGSSQCYWSLQPPAAIVVEVLSRTSSSWRSSRSSSRSSISRNTRKSTPQILAFSPPAMCCPVCALAFNGGALCVFYILCAALCVACCVVVHFALCAFDSSRLLCVHFHRGLFLTYQTQSKGMKDRQLHRYEFV